MMASFKLTKLERNWIFYDVGNSAFTLLITTIMPIYFNSLAESAGLSSVDYLAYWGYAASIVTLAVALMGPTFGTLADTRGFKRPIFLLFLVIGLVGCVALGASSNWLVFLVIFVIAKIGYQASLIFYDSMLSDVTTHERMDMVSSAGYAWGYIGSCAPFILSLALVLGGGAIGIPMTLAMQLAFCITAVWWLLFTLPLLGSYEQKHYVERPKHAVRESFARLGRTFRNVRVEKKVFFFLLAFFFYIDGVYTIIDMATAYGTALGLDTTGLLLALLVTQIVAFPFAILFGRLAARHATAKLITICIIAYFGIAVFAVFLEHQWQFWLLAVMVGMFQGGIQALSRSYYGKIIPKDHANEYYGFYDIFGKTASIIGTFLVATTTSLTGNASLGVLSIAVLLVAALVFLLLQKDPTRE